MITLHENELSLGTNHKVNGNSSTIIARNEMPEYNCNANRTCIWFVHDFLCPLPPSSYDPITRYDCLCTECGWESGASPGKRGSTFPCLLLCLEGSWSKVWKSNQAIWSTSLTRERIDETRTSACSGVHFHPTSLLGPSVINTRIWPTVTNKQAELSLDTTIKATELCGALGKTRANQTLLRAKAPAKRGHIVAATLVSCDVARPWQNAATLSRAARTQEMFLRIFRNILCVLSVLDTNVARVAKPVNIWDTWSRQQCCRHNVSSFFQPLTIKTYSPAFEQKPDKRVCPGVRNSVRIARGNPKHNIESHMKQSCVDATEHVASLTGSYTSAA